jgi:xanthine dehydrogenase accessory factor
MREVMGALDTALPEQRPFVLATLVGIKGSAPRQLGTTMLVRADGTVAGSLSAGCVDAAAYDRAMSLLGGDGRAALAEHGPADDAGWEVGLTCGGTVQVLVRVVTDDDRTALRGLVDAVEAGRRITLVTVIAGDTSDLGAVRVSSYDGSEGAAEAWVDTAAGVLVQPFPEPARLVVFGSDDVAAALAALAGSLGYRVTVCDPRPTFATTERFPGVEVVVEWPDHYLRRVPPDERTVLCLLTHEQRFEIPLLAAALRAPAAYIGAVGSRRTAADRLASLREHGLTADELARLHAPMGLDLRGSTPAETALSIMAEVLAARGGGSGAPLTATTGPVHRPGSAP